MLHVSRLFFHTFHFLTPAWCCGSFGFPGVRCGRIRSAKTLMRSNICDIKREWKNWCTESCQNTILTWQPNRELHSKRSLLRGVPHYYCLAVIGHWLEAASTKTWIGAKAKVATYEANSWRLSAKHTLCSWTLSPFLKGAQRCSSCGRAMIWEIFMAWSSRSPDSPWLCLCYYLVDVFCCSYNFFPLYNHFHFITKISVPSLILSFGFALWKLYLHFSLRMLILHITNFYSSYRLCFSVVFVP